jgi:uncharacterized membrane protein
MGRNITITILLLCVFLLAGCAGPSMIVYQRLPDDYKQVNIKHHEILYPSDVTVTDHLKEILKQKVTTKISEINKTGASKTVSLVVQVDRVEIAHKGRAAALGRGGAQNVMAGSVTILDFETKNVLGKYGITAEKNYAAVSFAVDLEERIAEEFTSQIADIFHK